MSSGETSDETQHPPQSESSFWRWFEDARMARGYHDATSVGRAAGISLSAISAWKHEGRVPDLDSSRALARVFRVPVTVVLYYAGHLALDDLTLLVHPVTGQEQIALLADPTGAAGTLPVPATALAPGSDPLARARTAILSIPDELVSQEAKLDLIALLDAQSAASEIAARLRARGRAAPPFSDESTRS